MSTKRKRLCIGTHIVDSQTNHLLRQMIRHIIFIFVFIRFLLIFLLFMYLYTTLCVKNRMSCLCFITDSSLITTNTMMSNVICYTILCKSLLFVFIINRIILCMKLNLPPDMKCCRKNIESGSKGENGISSLFTPENDIRLCHHMVLFQFHFTHLQNKGQTHT